jgi:hypothetical protein
LHASCWWWHHSLPSDPMRDLPVLLSDVDHWNGHLQKQGRCNSCFYPLCISMAYNLCTWTEWCLIEKFLS